MALKIRKWQIWEISIYEPQTLNRFLMLVIFDWEHQIKFLALVF